MFFFRLAEAQTKDLRYPSPISLWLSLTCRKVGEWTSHFCIISPQIFRTGRYMFAVLSNWHQCTHPVCSHCQCCWRTWHSDLLAISPYPDAVHGRNKMPWVLSLSSQQHLSPDSQDSRTAWPPPAYGESKMFCAILWECSGCSSRTDCSWCPKRGHCHGSESQWWFLTRFGKSHVEAKKLYWCHHLSKQIWNSTELRNRFCISIGIKDDAWPKQRHPRGRYMSMQKTLIEENSTLCSSSWKFFLCERQILLFSGLEHIFPNGT